MVNVGKYQNSKRTDSTRPKYQNLAIHYTIYFHGMPCLWMTKRPPKTNTMRLATRRIPWSWPSQSVCIVLRACRWDMLNLYRWQFDGRDDHELIVLDLSIVNQPGAYLFYRDLFFIYRMHGKASCSAIFGGCNLMIVGESPWWSWQKAMLVYWRYW